jgi:3-hydroxyisobutyrate dehydrogenase-like beta-hydroxyacid dehydrogenase
VQINQSQQMPRTDIPNIAILGFGEAAQAFCQGWAAGQDHPIRTFDILSTEQIKSACDTLSVTPCQTPAGAIAQADVIFSLVTADQSLNAAQSTQSAFPQNALYFDCNSCTPDTKRAAAKIIDAAGGRYVDVAVMAPVHPALHKTPLLISGPHATAALQTLTQLHMNASITPGDIGAASTIKMLRSVMAKGIEALIAECLLAARHVGVENTILASLEKSYPGLGWSDRAAYALDRMTRHGPRRAAEMREVAKTLQHLDLPSPMSQATANWQQLIGDMGISPDAAPYKALADQILLALPETTKRKETT